jgi:predicted TIM-barrel fold metal-dependent hydrolase
VFSTKECRQKEIAKMKHRTIKAGLSMFGISFYLRDRLKCFSLTLLLMILYASPLFSQFRSSYPDIPRIDVHTHVADDRTGIANYLDLRRILLDSHAVDLAIWINLGDRNVPIENIDAIMEWGQGRVLCSIADYAAHDGLKYPPEALQDLQKQGFVGYKIWSGPWYRRLEKKEEGFPYIDDPAHEATFAEMERIGFLGASIHIADPNGPWKERTDWLADPIEYWREINAWRKVLERHPNLVVVAAHGNWLLCQDAQIDYLRNMLATFPHLHIDLAATFQYFHLVDRDNLRAFMIEWADRILFGTDIGRWKDVAESSLRAKQYIRAFQILETSQYVKGGFFGGPDIKGLDLPREVLEKIYYRNAMRLYPLVKESLVKLGHKVQ